MVLRAIIGIVICVVVSGWAVYLNNKYISFTRDDDDQV